MFGIGMPELVVILVIALMVFGAKSLPEIGSGLGKAIRGFKEAADEGSKAPLPPTRTGSPSCPHCGKEYIGEAAFCPQCGKKLRES
jgi:sec-independent protein translocase protein TatA